MLAAWGARRHCNRRRWTTLRSASRSWGSCPAGAGARWSGRRSSNRPCSSGSRSSKTSSGGIPFARNQAFAAVSVHLVTTRVVTCNPVQSCRTSASICRYPVDLRQLLTNVQVLLTRMAADIAGRLRIRARRQGSAADAGAARLHVCLKDWFCAVSGTSAGISSSLAMSSSGCSQYVMDFCCRQVFWFLVCYFVDASSCSL